MSILEFRVPGKDKQVPNKNQYKLMPDERIRALHNHQVGIHEMGKMYL